jgi:hypothetical protein
MPLCPEVSNNTPATYWLFQEKSCQAYKDFCDGRVECPPYDAAPVSNRAEIKEFWFKSLIFTALGSEAKIDGDCLNGAARRGDPLAIFTKEDFGHNLWQQSAGGTQNQLGKIAAEIKRVLDNKFKYFGLDLTINVSVDFKGYDSHLINIKIGNSLFSIKRTTGKDINFSWV